MGCSTGSSVWRALGMCLVVLACIAAVRRESQIATRGMAQLDGAVQIGITALMGAKRLGDAGFWEETGRIEVESPDVGIQKLQPKEERRAKQVDVIANNASFSIQPSSETDGESQDNLDTQDGAKAHAQGDVSLAQNGSSLQRIRVALFHGDGVSPRSWKNVLGVLKCALPDIKIKLTKDLFYAADRSMFDVLIIPGGLAATIREPYKPRFGELKAKIKDFIRGGGGYVGICAGAYLAGYFTISPYTTNYINLGVGYFTSTRWELANETLQPRLSISDGEGDRERIYYANGPVFRKPKVLDPKKTSIRNPKVLLSASQDARLQIHTSTGGRLKSSSKTFQGMPLVVAADFGRGRVVVSGTHQETDVSEATRAKMYVGGPSVCGSYQAKVLLNMIFYSARRGETQTENDIEGARQSI